MKKLLILLLLVPSLSWGEHKNESEKMEFVEISDNLLMCFAYYEMTRDALSRTSEDHSDAIKKINDIQALQTRTALLKLSRRFLKAFPRTGETMII